MGMTSVRPRIVLRLTLTIGCALLGAACAQMGQFGRTECLSYETRNVTESYCARMAPQTCRTYNGRTTCYGGGYCQQTSQRTREVQHCTRSQCKAGYVEIDGKCLTEEERREGAKAAS